MVLLGTELRRLTSRRLVRVVAFVAVAAVVGLFAFLTVRSDPNGFGDDQLRTTSLWLTQGRAAALGVSRDNAVAQISLLVYLLVIVIGASAVGAEYRAGTLTTVLTWEPRRLRLLTMRLLASALVGAGVYLIVVGVSVGATAIGAAARGSTAGADADFWRTLASVVLRGAALAAALAAISGAFATLGRNTAAALGVFFGYLIAVEAILRGVAERFVPWFLTPNAGAFFAWETVRQNQRPVGPGAGTARLALYVGTAVVLAVGVFRRRDVT